MRGFAIQVIRDADLLDAPRLTAMPHDADAGVRVRPPHAPGPPTLTEISPP